jgi:hypothetical protein
VDTYHGHWKDIHEAVEVRRTNYQCVIRTSSEKNVRRTSLILHSESEVKVMHPQKLRLPKETTGLVYLLPRGLRNTMNQYESRSRFGESDKSGRYLSYYLFPTASFIDHLGYTVLISRTNGQVQDMTKMPDSLEAFFSSLTSVKWDSQNAPKIFW